MLHASSVAVFIVFRNFKTNKTHDLFQIHLKDSGNEDVCPVKHSPNMFKFLVISLFPCFNSWEVSQQPMHLQNIIRFIGLNPALYKGHSFKIGTATHATHLDYSENCIQKMGRWKSDGIHRYIRLSSFTFKIHPLKKYNDYCG